VSVTTLQKCRDLLFREDDGTLVRMHMHAYACETCSLQRTVIQNSPRQRLSTQLVRESTSYDVMTTEFDSKFYRKKKTHESTYVHAPNYRFQLMLMQSSEEKKTVSNASQY